MNLKFLKHLLESVRARLHVYALLIAIFVFHLQYMKQTSMQNEIYGQIYLYFTLSQLSFLPRQVQLEICT